MFEANLHIAPSCSFALKTCFYLSYKNAFKHRYSNLIIIRIKGKNHKKFSKIVCSQCPNNSF